MEIISSERIKLNLARLKKGGSVFEISVDPDLAVKFKKGEAVEVGEVLKAEQIFSDAKKGELASEGKLKEVFGSGDVRKIAAVIIKEGEIQLTSEYREGLREQKKRKIIGLIHREGVDPATGLPHPPQRIENAFEEAKVKIDEYKGAEEQLEEVLSQIRVVLPIKLEQAKLELKIPSSYAGKAYSLVQKYCKILQEEWLSDGSWSASVEMPGGLKMEFLDKLNSMTHGDVVVEEQKG